MTTKINKATLINYVFAHIFTYRYEGDIPREEYGKNEARIIKSIVDNDIVVAEKQRETLVKYLDLSAAEYPDYTALKIGDLTLAVNNEHIETEYVPDPIYIKADTVYIFHTFYHHYQHVELRGRQEAVGCPCPLDPDGEIPTLTDDDEGVDILFARRAKDIEPELFKIINCSDKSLTAWLVLNKIIAYDKE